MRRTLLATSTPLAAPKAPSRWPTAFFMGLGACLLGAAWFYFSASTASMGWLAQAMYTTTGIGFFMLGSFSLCCARWEWQKRAWTMQYTHREPNLLPARPTRQRVAPSLTSQQKAMPIIKEE